MMSARAAFNKLKKNIEEFESSKANGTNVMEDFTFKCMCVYPLVEIIESHLNELTDEEQKEFRKITENYQ